MQFSVENCSDNKWRFIYFGKGKCTEIFQVMSNIAKLQVFKINFIF